MENEETEVKTQTGEKQTITPIEHDQDQDQKKDQIDDTWEAANYDDLACIKRPNEPRRVKIPIDFKNKKYILFEVQDLTIDDHLGLMETVFSIDPDTKKAKVNLKAFYQACYARMVVGGNPPLQWKQLKYYNASFFNELKKLFPNPLSDEKTGGITKDEEGN